MKFEYPTGKGNVIFYKKILSRIISIPLNNEHLKTLEKIKDLSPGDFKTVRDRYFFHPEKQLDHQILIGALQEEAKLKKVHRGDKPIGF